MNPWFLSIPLTYLLGSIPFGYLLIKLMRDEDVRATGSGNIGATNVARSGGKALGIATLLLDLGKAFVAVRIAQHLAPSNYDLAVAPQRPSPRYPRPRLPHCRRLGSRGGKGIASALGVFLAAHMALRCRYLRSVLTLVLFLTHYVSLASIIALRLPCHCSRSTSCPTGPLLPSPVFSSSPSSLS